MNGIIKNDVAKNTITTIEVAEMNNDREIVNYLDDYLVELSKYILQVNIWANKAAELDGKPAKFDKYFDDFTII